MSFLRPTRATSALLVAAFAALGAASCSLVVESRDAQCETDADCKGFEDGVCDVAGGVCVERAAATTSSGLATGGSTSASSGGGDGGGGGSGSTGSGCVGPDGCFACEPETQPEFLNGCTDADCVPYDNGRIADLLDEDGSLPDLPEPPR